MPSKSRRIHNFLSTQETFSKIGAHGMSSHARPQKSLNKFKKTEVITSIFSNHNGMKLEINYRKKTGKTTNTWRLNYMILKIRSMKKSKRKSKNIWDLWKWKHNFLKSIGHSKSCFKRDVHNDTGSPQETRKISYKQPNITPKGTGKKEQSSKLVEGKK